MTTIKNLPEYVKSGNYIVVAREVDGEFWFYGAYEDSAKANKAADMIDGYVFNDVRG